MRSCHKDRAVELAPPPGTYYENINKLYGSITAKVEQKASVGKLGVFGSRAERFPPQKLEQGGFGSLLEMEYRMMVMCCARAPLRMSMSLNLFWRADTEVVIVLCAWNKLFTVSRFYCHAGRRTSGILVSYDPPGLCPARRRKIRSTVAKAACSKAHLFASTAMTNFGRGNQCDQRENRLQQARSSQRMRAGRRQVVCDEMGLVAKKIL